MLISATTSNVAITSANASSKTNFVAITSVNASANTSTLAITNTNDSILAITNTYANSMLLLWLLLVEELKVPL